MSGEKKKVLIVDDASFTRKILRKILTKLDYIEIVGEATNGNEGIEAYKKFKPDLVTLDLVMPEKGGIETVTDILKIDKDATILIVSALGQEEFILEATKRGAKDFIQKPFKEEEVIEVVEKIIKLNK